MLFGLTNTPATC
jgi:hypothetical protein